MCLSFDAQDSARNASAAASQGAEAILNGFSLAEQSQESLQNDKAEAETEKGLCYRSLMLSQS